MTTTTTGPLVWTNNTEDRDRASDGISRYGYYLRQRRDWFDFGDMSRASFAATCWRIASAPIMSPGYLGHRADIATIEATIGEDDGGLVMRLEVPLVHGQLTSRTALARQQTRDWQTEAVWGTDDFTRYEPYRIERPTVLVSATVLLPVPDEELPAAPMRDPGADLTNWAKSAVGDLTAFTAAYGYPLVEALLSEGDR